MVQGENRERLDGLVDYLRPVLDDLRKRDLEFESYLLEMVILSLQEQSMFPVKPAQAA
jgi:hypothetical protein